MLPNLSFYCPQIGGLSGIGRAMHLAQGREPRPKVLAKIPILSAIRIDTQKLTHDFHCQHFTISQPRRNASCSHLLAHQPVIDNTKYADYKRGNIHVETSAFVRCGKLQSLQWSPVLFNTCTSG